MFLLDLNGGADDVSGNGIAPLFLTIVSAFATFERDRIAACIRQSKQAQKARREYSGGPPEFGWKHDGDRRLVKVPEEQKALKTIRRLREQGKSLRSISLTLAERGIRLSHVGVARALLAAGDDR